MTPPSRPWSTLLAPLGGLYLAAADLRNRLYDRGLRPIHQVGVPVLSVGNLVAGGTGKTPLVAFLGRSFLERGRRVAVVSRGYGGRSPNPVQVVWDGTRARVGVEEAGDEPFLLGRLVPGLRVVVGADRVAAARRAVEELGADLLVLDDGFQHRRLARDCDVLLLAAHDPLGGGLGLPAGLLRERIAPALDRVHLIVVTGKDSPPSRDLEKTLARRAGDLPIFHERHEPTALLGLGEDATEPPTNLAGRRIFAVAGLARPAALRETLADLGAEIAGFRDLPDHHRFRPGEVEALCRAARDVGAESIVTTEKDAVRWPTPAPGDHPVVVLRVEARLDDPAGFLRAVQQHLERLDSWTASRPPV